LGVGAVRDEVDGATTGTAQRTGQGKRKGAACWLVGGAWRRDSGGGLGSQRRVETLWRRIRWTFPAGRGRPCRLAATACGPALAVACRSTQRLPAAAAGPACSPAAATGEGAQGDAHGRVAVAVGEGSEADGRQSWRGEELEAAMATPGPDLGEDRRLGWWLPPREGTSGGGGVGAGPATVGVGGRWLWWVGRKPS
jgi:hypothetical protein